MADTPDIKIDPIVSSDKSELELLRAELAAMKKQLGPAVDTTLRSTCNVCGATVPEGQRCAVHADEMVILSKADGTLVRSY
jgi:hypothetical protein